MKQRLVSLARRMCGLCCLVLFALHFPVFAETLKVGPSAGTPGSSCQFGTPQAAIDALPDNGEQHVIELEAVPYLGNDATIDVDGLRVIVRAVYNNGSGCRSAAAEPAQLIATNTALAGGRTVVVTNEGDLTLEHVSVIGNQRGGILVRDSTLVLTSSLVANHSTPAGSSGAGIVVEGGHLLLKETSLNDNVAGANGGAVFCARSTRARASVSADQDTRFISNSALNGGAIYQFRGCTVNLEDVGFGGNQSIRDGGAIATDPSSSGIGDENVLVLDDYVSFLENRAERDGGAIELSGNISLLHGSESFARFEENTAGRFGGAIDVGSTAALARLSNAQFLANTARERGGAISVRGGLASLRSDCGEGTTVNENYCAVFEENSVANEGVLARRGGALSLDSGELLVDGFAFRNSRGPSTLTSESGGIVAAVNTGFMKVSNSIVYDSFEGLSPTTHLFYLMGGRTQFSFNTMVDTPAGTVVFLRPAARAEFIGNIIAGNSSGIAGDGTITGTCNNAQLGATAEPLDPRFATTDAGRFRLAPDSLMIDRALICSSGSLPAGYEFPIKDLDGRVRREPGEDERELDLGAFEFRIDDRSIFRSGFDGSPRGIEKDAQFGPGY